MRGVDVLTSIEADMLGATDESHLKLAMDTARVILTQDDDFIRLAAQGHNHAGIVYAQQHTPIGRIISGLIPVYQVLSPDDMMNHIEFL